MAHLNLKLLMMLQVHLSVSDDLDAGFVDNALRFDPVPTNGRPYFCPADPVECAEEEHADADDGEHKVRVPFSVPVAIRRDKWHDCQKHICEEIERRDGQVRVPRRRPVFGLAKVQVDETGGDKGIDPRSRVRVEVDDEVVCRTGRRSDQDDDCDDPMQK